MNILPGVATGLTALTMIAGAAGPARAGACGGAVGARFVEAARVCGDAAPAVPSATSSPAPSPAPFVPVEVATRETVSVSMPGARRVAAAVRAVEAQGGGAPTPALVTAIAHRYRINPRLLASMMRAESAGRPGAVSNKGALGLMQVMPATARSMGVAEPRQMLTNPVLAVSTGAAYLKRLQKQFGNDVPLVVAAYNAGPGAVEKAGRRVPRYRETQGYVRRVMGGAAARRR